MTRWKVAIVVVPLLVVLAREVWTRGTVSHLEATVRDAEPASGEALRALYTLHHQHEYSGGALVALLDTVDPSQPNLTVMKRDDLFGLGPAGLTDAERRELIPALVEVLAPSVQGARDDEELFGALLTATDLLRDQDAALADSARERVLDAMRRARGEPPALRVEDGSWTVPIGGTFTVGCFGEVDAFCRDDEALHEVTLSPYRMRKHEETVGEYRRFAPDHLLRQRIPDDWPVFDVSWYAATAYSAWRGAALPTEAQWEVAARGGSADYRKTAWFSGPNPEDLDRVGFTLGNTRRVAETFGEGHLLRATDQLSELVHPLGLTHMHGNLAEWCRDWFTGEAPTGRTEGPATPPDPARPWRVIRGGAWDGAPETARAAARAPFVPSGTLHSVGFRLVLNTEAAPSSVP